MRITKDEIKKRLRKRYSFKQEKPYHRRSFIVFHDSQWIVAGVVSKAECRRRIEWTVNWNAKKLYSEICQIRKLGFTVTA